MEINTGISKLEGKKEIEVRKMEEKTLREVIMKIRLEKLDTQEGITVEALLDSRVTGLVMSLEFEKNKALS